MDDLGTDGPDSRGWGGVSGSAEGSVSVPLGLAQSIIWNLLPLL